MVPYGKRILGGVAARAAFVHVCLWVELDIGMNRLISVGICGLLVVIAVGLPLGPRGFPCYASAPPAGGFTCSDVSTDANNSP